jgi:ATP-dependent Clp protease adaptor protein ClpS
VIQLLGKVFGYDVPKAFQLALEIHERGKAIVWSGTLELAELKRDQIMGYGPDNFGPKPVEFPLGVSVEPLP